MDSLVNKMKKSKIAVSPLDGRFIDFSGIDWDNGGMVAHAINQAKNLPFQGAGASTTKKALILIDKEIKSRQLDARIVNCIHDEILVESAKEIAEEVAKIVEEKMIEGFNYFAPNVPMTVKPEIDTHWIH